MKLDYISKQIFVQYLYMLFGCGLEIKENADFLLLLSAVLCCGSTTVDQLCPSPWETGPCPTQHGDFISMICIWIWLRLLSQMQFLMQSDWQCSGSKVYQDLFDGKRWNMVQVGNGWAKQNPFWINEAVMLTPASTVSNFDYLNILTLMNYFVFARKCSFP